MQQQISNIIIVVYYKKNWYRLTCELKRIGQSTDTWEVRARNKTLVFENNRPRMDKAGLSGEPWTWTLVKGELQDVNLENAIVRVLEDAMRKSN